MKRRDITRKARDVLGVPEEADLNMIRQAYRDLAKKYHPDRNPNDQSLSDKFKLISEAYEILCGDKNTGSYGVLQAAPDKANEPSFYDKSYREWWMERFKDLF